MTARTVLHGVDQSAPSHAQLPRQGNMGSDVYVEDLRGRRVYDEKARAWLPEEYVPFCWDFAVHGGKVGTIDLGVPIPAGTIILDGLVDVVEAITSDDAATIALHVEEADDILAAATLDTNGAAGLHDVVPDGTAAKAIKATEDRTVTLTVAEAALTAGKFYGFLRCLRGLTA